MSGHLLLPMNTDNSVYQTMAQDILWFHKLPYLGSWDENFPGVIFLHALSILLFGSSDLSFEILAFIFAVGIAYLLFVLGSRFLDHRTALVGSVIFSILYVHSGYWISGQRDMFAVLFILLAVESLFRYAMKGSISWLAVAGFSAGYAVFIRPTFGLTLIVLGLMLWKSQRETSHRLQNLLLFFLASGLAFVAFLIPYFGIPNALAELWNSLIRFNFEVYSSESSVFGNLIPVILRQWPLVLLALLGSYLLWRNRRRSRLSAEESSEIGWWLLILVSVVLSPTVMRKALAYQFFPFYTMLTPLAAVAIVSITDAVARYIADWRTKSQIGVANVFLILIFSVVGIKAMLRDPIVPFFQALGSGHALELAKDTYVAEQGFFNPVFDIRSERKVVSYLSTRLGAEEPFEYATLWPGLTWRLHRPQATRFTMLYELCMNHAGTPSSEPSAFTSYQRDWRKEYIESLDRVQPKYIIVARGSYNDLTLVHDIPSVLVHTIPGFDSLISSSYRIDTTIDEFALYRHILEK